MVEYPKASSQNHIPHCLFVSLHSEASEACDSGGRLRHAMQKHETETGNEDHTTLRILHFSDAMKQIKP
jgi:hypothetical protein